MTSRSWMFLHNSKIHLFTLMSQNLLIVHSYPGTKQWKKCKLTTWIGQHKKGLGIFQLLNDWVFPSNRFKRWTFQQYVFLFTNTIMQIGMLKVKYGLSTFLCTISLGQNEAYSRRDTICYASALSLYFFHRDILWTAGECMFPRAQSLPA